MSPSLCFAKGSEPRRVAKKCVKYTFYGLGTLVCAPCCAVLWGAVSVIEGRKWAEAARYKRPPKVSKRGDALGKVEQGDSDTTREMFGRALSEKGSKADAVDVAIETIEEYGWRKLSYEIRTMIYEEYFFAVETVTIMFDGEQKVRGRLRTKLGDRPEDEALIPTGYVSFLATCKSIYFETFPLLYSRLTYEFFNPIAFLIFCATITPNAFHSLNNIVLDFHTFESRGRRPKYLDWPESPQVLSHRDRGTGYKLPIKKPLLQRRKNYRNFRLGGNERYYNPIVMDACGNRLFRKMPTIWTWTCTVLGQITDLRNLNVRTRHYMIRNSDDVFETLGQAGIEPEGRCSMQSCNVSLWAVQPCNILEDKGEVLRCRYALIDDEKKWIEIPKGKWETEDESLR